MIVADTNLIAYLLVPGEASKVAEKVFRLDSEWAAAILWRSELRNVLVAHIRRGLMSQDDALEVIERAKSLLEGREFEAPSGAVLELAASSSCSAYDCEFVALAQRLDVQLVTSDRAVLQAFPKLAVAPSLFAGP